MKSNLQDFCTPFLNLTILGFDLFYRLLKEFFDSCFVEFSRNLIWKKERKGGWMRKEEDKAELEAIGLFCNFQWKPFWNAYGNNYHGRCKRRAIFTPREFFERPAVPFIVFHLPDTVQSIHASLNIPPPPSSFSLPPRSNSKQSFNPVLRTAWSNRISKFSSMIIP